MFQVRVFDPSGISEYYFTTRDLVVASFALTYSAQLGKITYEKAPGGDEQVFYTNTFGVRSHIGQITDLTVPGLVRDKVEHF